MAAKKIFVIFGATGNQGGSVIKSMLADAKASQEFKLRGITRDPSSGRAKALAEKGVECVAGDINDKASLKSAFKGAHSVFAVTNYWEKMDDKLEVQQGKNIADAAKVGLDYRATDSVEMLIKSFSLNQEENIQHLIFSTLFNVNEITNGTYKNVYHFDSKAAIEAYIRSSAIPASFFMPGFFMSNLESALRPDDQSPSTYTMAMPFPPTTPIPFFDPADDSGKFVKAMVMKRDEVLGKNVLGATAYNTPEDVIKAFKEVKKGVQAQFVQIDKDTYMGGLAKAGMPQYIQEELYENMAFLNDFGYYGKRSLDWSHSLLDEKLITLTEFVGKSSKF